MEKKVVVAIIVLLLLLGFYCTIKLNTVERFDKNAPKTIIGGIISTQLVLGSGDSTIVRKLSGNNGKTIILVHSSPFDQQIWYSFFTYTQTMKKEGNPIPSVISFDLVGHGSAWVPVDMKYNDTDLHNHAWTIDRFTRELQNVYDTFAETDTVSLVGFGFGGLVVQDFSLKHPNLVEHLFVLQRGTGPGVGLTEEINYMSDRIKNNPQISYLTLDAGYVQKELCAWFKSTDTRRCPTVDNYDVFNTTEYLVGDKLWRVASATTTLQINKLGSTTDLRPQWEHARVEFPITVLYADDDVYTAKSNLETDIQLYKRSSPNVRGYMVNGKHGFSMVHTDYIYSMVGGSDMSKDVYTLQTF